MTHHHPHSITIDDERYPGRAAEVLAWDWAMTAKTKTTTLLLLGANGEYVVHQHTAPAERDLLAALDGDTARSLYRALRMHIVPFERLAAAGSQ